MKINCLFIILFLIVLSAHSQEFVKTAPSLPGAPVSNSLLDEQSSSAGPQSGSNAPTAAPPETKGIEGFSNLQSFDADESLPPQTVRKKFKTDLQDNFGFYSIALVGAEAGIHQASNQYPAFRQGGAGYGRYYWRGFADQADENLWVISIIPSALHEDSRYYRLGHGGFFKRTGYALSRAAITRNDHGGSTLNVAEIVGSGSAAGISSVYYPGQYRTWTKIGQRWLSNVIVDGATFAAKEFWPDVNRLVFHRHEQGM